MRNPRVLILLVALVAFALAVMAAVPFIFPAPGGG